jgi:hypothetical protein
MSPDKRLAYCRLCPEGRACEAQAGDQRTMGCRVRDEAGKIVLMASLVLMIEENP